MITDRIGLHSVLLPLPTTLTGGCDKGTRDFVKNETRFERDKTGRYDSQYDILFAFDDFVTCSFYFISLQIGVLANTPAELRANQMGAKIQGLFQPSSQGLSISHKKRYPGNEVGFICNFVFKGAAFQRDHFPKSIIVLNISAENKRLQKDISCAKENS